MPPESPRILELRRRVQSDPASIAFAQLAEEYRRAGSFDEAIKCCRTGLARHPGYLSARVTLGRALIEMGSLDEAARELELVLRSAPDNLAAIRGMAEIEQRRGRLADALTFYKRALALARHDPELEETVMQIDRELGNIGKPSTSPGLSFAQAESELLSAAARLGPKTPPKPVASTSAPTNTSGATVDKPRASASAREELRASYGETSPKPLRGEGGPDPFARLLENLGQPNATPPPVTEKLISESVSSTQPATAPSEPPPFSAGNDPFAALEDELRALDEKLASTFAPTNTSGATVDRSTSAPTNTSGATVDKPAAPDAPGGVLDELETWLASLQAERERLNDQE